MNQTPYMYLTAELSDVVLPEGLAFASPEELPASHDEEALHEFLREFEDSDEPLEMVGLFPLE